jgi:hypothetical protein
MAASSAATRNRYYEAQERKRFFDVQTFKVDAPTVRHPPI